MYLIDTDVISELRKGDKANVGVRSFFAETSSDLVDLYLSVVTIGEMRQGMERIRHRRDHRRRGVLPVGSHKLRRPRPNRS